MSNAITLHDFGVAYEKKTVLSGINAAIPAGKITAIIGPSGCGKSTLLKAINRMLELETDAEVTGSIHISGKDTHAIPAEELRRKVGMVFQTPAPFPMSIYKNMVYAPQYYGIRGRQKLEQIVRENLEVTGLWEEVKGLRKRR